MTAPIDAAFLDDQTGGDLALKRDVLQLFVEQAQALATQLALPPATLAASLHRLQGSARAIGAYRLDTVARVLEARLIQGGPPPVEAVETLRDCLSETCGYAAALLLGLDATVSPNGVKAVKHLEPSMSHADQRGIRAAEG